jgi:putative SOS response-associated peptidase YedK
MMKPLHDRMPVILPYEQANLWLDPDIQVTKQVKPLLKPAPDEDMELEAIDPEKLKTG